MQSSATVACRAGVMLICLIAIPLSALFGTRLPDLVQRLLDQQSDKTRVETWDSLAEAPEFEATASPGPWAGGPNSAIREGRARDLPTDFPSGEGAPESVASIGKMADRRKSEGGFLPAGRSLGERASSASRMEYSRAIPANYQSPLEPTAVSGTAGRPAESPPQPFEPTDQFARIQERLRRLGATYYVLETWGDRGQYYHFHARMALGPGEDAVRHFDATDADPLAAMARVLGEVERWRGGE